MFKINEYRSTCDQVLRNVLIPFPTMIWIKKGRKKIVWNSEVTTFHKDEALLLPANSRISFTNYPEHAEFHSIALTLLQEPPNHIMDNYSEFSGRFAPKLRVSNGLRYCIESLISSQDHTLSEMALTYLLYSFYAELKEKKSLYYLFSLQEKTISQRVIRVILAKPSDAHHVDNIAKSLFMSRATLNRKLSKENTTFFSILTQVRMSHALTLLQSNDNIQEVALDCGYESQTRFSQRFHRTFGITPFQYRKTMIKP